MSTERSAAENPSSTAGSRSPVGAGTASGPRSTARRPRGAVREGLIAAGLELARAGGPDAVVLREATRIVGVVPNAAYRHFADRDELLAAVCAAAMDEFGARMAAAVAAVPGERGNADAAFGRMAAVGTAYLDFARTEPKLFATAFAVPEQHPYFIPENAAGSSRTPLAQLRDVLDELVDVGLLDPRRREGIEFPVWSTVHGLAVLIEQGPLRAAPAEDVRLLTDKVLGFIAESLLAGAPGSGA
ncbi:TetR/AcrR family transcriptional regulator [Catenulispora rubra]|uniref:TetR/AcrR family transcriptional regulator n=1 Tax=Catenulispora rubra TaxID=280293 RepID=UPI001891FF09|nr:TetR/AcrR family transcriptional regulator [Catenulispora rubra]